jgi:hypothetical protein
MKFKDNKELQERVIIAKLSGKSMKEICLLFPEYSKSVYDRFFQTAGIKSSFDRNSESHKIKVSEGLKKAWDNLPDDKKHTYVNRLRKDSTSATNKRQSTLIDEIKTNKYGEWLITGDAIVNGNSIRCICSCGVQKNIAVYDLISNKTKSCGCSATKNSKETNMLKRCCEFVSQDPGVRAKRKETVTARYGVEYSGQIEAGKEKSRITSMVRYGVDCHLKSEKVKQKIKETNLERLGVEYPTQSKLVKDKVRATNLERYGVEYPSQSQSIQIKILQTLIFNDKTSAGERELRNYIESLGFNTRKSYIGGDNPKEIDIRVSNDKDEPLLYLEYNGEYHHNEANGRGEEYHLYKSVMCQEQKGFHLIHVFESEWLKKKDIWKGLIRSMLPSQEIKEYDITNCIVKEISNKEAKEFLSKHSLKPKTKSILNLGLFFRDELLEVMTFSKGTSLPKLSNHSAKLDIKVDKGLELLSKHAYSILGKFTTYVPYHLSNGNDYESAGYARVKLLKPSFQYWNNKAHRYTKEENPKFVKIWDCGKIKFTYSL